MWTTPYRLREDTQCIVGVNFFLGNVWKKGIYVKRTPPPSPPPCFEGRNNGNVDKRNLPKKFKPLDLLQNLYMLQRWSKEDAHYGQNTLQELIFITSYMNFILVQKICFPESFSGRWETWGGRNVLPFWQYCRNKHFDQYWYYGQNWYFCQIDIFVKLIFSSKLIFLSKLIFSSKLTILSK